VTPFRASLGAEFNCECFSRLAGEKTRRKATRQEDKRREDKRRQEKKRKDKNRTGASFGLALNASKAQIRCRRYLALKIIKRSQSRKSDKSCQIRKSKSLLRSIWHLTLARVKVKSFPTNRFQRIVSMDRFTDLDICRRAKRSSKSRRLKC
jgi:hypothetical protein